MIILKKIFFFLAYSFSCFSLLHASFPTLVYHDPLPLYSPRGVDALPALKAQFEKEKRWFSFDISFFSQQAKNARNFDTYKVPMGDRLGRINASGFFFDTDLKFIDFDGNSRELRWTTIDTASGDDYNAAKKVFPELIAAYDNLKTLANGAFVKEERFSLDYYDDLNNTRGFMSVEGKFKKRGFRSVLTCEPVDIFRFKVEWGCFEYLQEGYFNQALRVDNQAEEHQQELFDWLTNQKSIVDIAGYFGYDLLPQRKTTFEDVCISAECKYPIVLYGVDSEPAVTCYPFLGMGVWIPTGSKSDPSKFFSLASGNEGFLGFGLNGGFIFHFLDVVYASIEGSCTLFDTKAVILRYPTNQYQQGLYPFTKWFNKKPGMSWDVAISLCARHVFEGVSFYIDYLYAQHEKDQISSYIPVPDYTNPNDVKSLKSTSYLTSEHPYELLNLSPMKDEAVFETLAQASFWKSEIFTIGMSYEVTPGFELGLAFRGNLSGRQVTRTETLMGTIRFAF